MKTPDETKKGLECCARVGHCYECPYKEECLHSVDDAKPMHVDVLAYIQQLEAERDAAVEALKDFGGCMACNSASVSKKDSPCRECIIDGQVTHDYWIWRGVQKEDSNA